MQTLDKLIDRIAGSVGAFPLVSPRFRPRLYKMFGMTIGERAQISFDVTFLRRRKILVGDRTYIGAHCYFENHEVVDIRADAAIAAGCRFATGTHHVGPPNRRAGAQVVLPIVIGEGAWIGMNCTILPGVNVGSGTIIAAGSVVTKDCSPNALYAGVPAQFKRWL